MEEHVPITNISAEAFAELKKIAIKEYGEGVMTDIEIMDMGLRLLNLCDILIRPTEQEEQQQVRFSSLSDKEAQAFQYITDQLKHRNHSPSAREVAKHLGYSSSRTGLRVINGLIEKGVLVKKKTKGSKYMKILLE